MVGLAVLAPEMVVAQAPSIQGTFTYDAEASERIEPAIERAISRMNMVTRPVARGRLRRTNTPYQRLTISHTPTQVTIATDARNPIVSPANGSPVDWRREDGEMLKVSTEWKNQVLEQTFAAPDGKRINAYSVSPDGRTLTINVTVTSPRLPAPLTYRTVYRRAS
jgi:hypothetical protein